FNCVGVVLIVSTFWWHWGDSPAPVFFDLVTHLSSSSDIPRNIANAHTIFNVITTLALCPFIPLLAKLCMRIIPQTKQPEKVRHLELYLLHTPEIAISQAKNCMREMFGKAWNMVALAMNDYLFSAKKRQEKQTFLNDAEVEVDQFQAEITDYLTELTCRELTPRQAAVIPMVIHCINDAERIGDHAINIVNIANDIQATTKHLSSSARAELTNLTEMLSSQAHDTLLALKTYDKHLAGCAVENEKSIIAMADKYESNHLKRMAHKECTGALGVHFVELLSECRDVARHISNIAERSIEIGEKLHE
ncbi:MAG: PhoU domain-containing protein, partial [Victivallaceae bacterium]